MVTTTNVFTCDTTTDDDDALACSCRCPQTTTTVELKRWEKTNPDSIKNRCNLHWFSIKFQPFVVELMPLKTPTL